MHFLGSNLSCLEGILSQTLSCLRLLPPSFHTCGENAFLGSNSLLWREYHIDAGSLASSTVLLYIPSGALLGLGALLHAMWVLSPFFVSDHLTFRMVCRTPHPFIWSSVVFDLLKPLGIIFGLVQGLVFGKKSIAHSLIEVTCLLRNHILAL